MRDQQLFNKLRKLVDHLERERTEQIEANSRLRSRLRNQVPVVAAVQLLIAKYEYDGLTEISIETLKDFVINQRPWEVK